jgi:mono/diheme cytochrome c family protein
MIRALQITAIVVTALFLSVVIGLLLIEPTWLTREPSTPRDYFLYGSTGTELVPLPVFQVLPDLFPAQFQPAGPEAGDWIDQFGFVRGEQGVNEGMPLGISVTKYRPKSGAPSPVAFMGFNCAACHTAKIHLTDADEGVLVYGMGNPNIDLVAFGDAVKTSLLDEKQLTLETVEAARKGKSQPPLGPVDKLMISLWLKEVRTKLREELPMRNWPFGGRDLRNADLFPSGPGRNQPMKETVRFLIQQTPLPDGGSSKIPCLYQQDHRVWAQFDGALGDPITRSSLAALGVGASIYNLRVSGILNTIRQTYLYTKTLSGPKYSEVFRGEEARGAAIDGARAERGRDVYQHHCAACHGSPGPQAGEWVPGKGQGKVVSAAVLGTDSARVSFRYYEKMAQLIYDFYPEGHPIKPKRSDLRPNPGDVPGYISSPLESVFSRAPYLHNGSVPTLAELINLKPRRSVFYRGANLYDPIDVGLVTPEQPDTKRYFRFDTRAYGNFNGGHDYPWAYKAPGWDEEALKDLLEYLKTL